MQVRAIGEDPQKLRRDRHALCERDTDDIPLGAARAEAACPLQTTVVLLYANPRERGPFSLAAGFATLGAC